MALTLNTYQVLWESSLISGKNLFNKTLFWLCARCLWFQKSNTLQQICFPIVIIISIWLTWKIKHLYRITSKQILCHTKALNGIEYHVKKSDYICRSCCTLLLILITKCHNSHKYKQLSWSPVSRFWWPNFITCGL